MSQKGDYARAIPLARRAWELDPNNPVTADTLGWLLYKSGRDKAQGLALIEQAARGAPTDAEIRAHLKDARGGVNSSPSLLGEGDRAKRGGGENSKKSAIICPSTSLRLVPPPRGKLGGGIV